VVVVGDGVFVVGDGVVAVGDWVVVVGAEVVAMVVVGDGVVAVLVVGVGLVVVVVVGTEIVVVVIFSAEVDCREKVSFENLQYSRSDKRGGRVLAFVFSKDTISKIINIVFIPKSFLLYFTICFFKI